ncbi:hypothetical protein [Bacillus sp. EAC]|uniref:hypothetical protein n=1 Tax=Bacillus sp. EAC TaxID=1978338 RepID=UPI000B42EB93|nr:hypothetical protein [Bacillus sp. EAC]
MKKKLIFTLSILIVILVIGFYKIFIRGTVENISFLSIHHVEASDYLINIVADNPNSASMISGVDYKYKNRTVYLKFRSAPVNQFGNSINEKNILITDYFPNVKKIVLLGKTNQKKTVWAIE